MANPKFAAFSDQDLKVRFSVSVGMPIEGETVEIIDEMTARGYIFDDRYRDFLTCEQWNRRHGDLHPLDCSEWAK